MHRRILLMPLFVGTVTAVARQAPQQPSFADRVDVQRVIVDARVVNDDGSPVLGLIAADFRVKIDGKPARIDSAAWFGGDGLPPPAATLESSQFAGNAPALSPTRLIVFVFQKDLHPIRVAGLMRMLIESQSFLDTLGSNDRVAVLSFDSHLKIWTDFTADRERLAHLFERGILLERPSAVERAEPLSLLPSLDPAKGRRTYTIEKGLQLIAEALKPLEGSKSVVLIGWGFGTFGIGGVTMDRDYERAREALRAARTAVFSIDVTQADYHSLETGLKIVSEETGGFYMKTNIFSKPAMQHLAGALAGYYALFVEKPDSPLTSHSLDVQLTRRKGTVLARRGYDN